VAQLDLLILMVAVDALELQVQTALSAQTSGFGLWTSDIGGYSAVAGGNCDATNSSYRELVVRWFQFGVTAPIFRQHGQRETEIWKFGAEAEVRRKRDSLSRFWVELEGFAPPRPCY
jgi:alpha-glucosidase (family GH31 glycosyl hydrolase)